MTSRIGTSKIAATVLVWALVIAGCMSVAAQQKDPKQNQAEPAPTGQQKLPSSYSPVVIDKPFQQIFDEESATKADVVAAQRKLLDERYDLADNPASLKMSGGRRSVQQGVRVKLRGDMSWEDLARLSPEEIKQKDLFPMGFRPLPHVKHQTGGMVFPQNQIDRIRELEQRELDRFDVGFDLPDHLTPEFPPPIFLTTHPQLGDVSKGQLLSFRNYYDIFNGILTPVQIEGLRLLLTPFPQQQFNQTEDRKVKEAHLGVACLDCHANFHTNATFHLNPDTRPQANRPRIETPSLRGVFNQQIHGSKRSLRSIEDFTEFEQRTAYFDGDHVTAAKKGVHLPNRSDQVAMMAQMQTMIDFPPAPKLTPLGKLDPTKASELEKKGQELFFGKAQCSTCHPAPFYLDHLMHDLQLQRFYTPETIANQFNVADGPIKAFTLRGIKDSPPYHHDGRLMTLEDTVEFFNLVLGLQLAPDEKEALVAFMRCL